MPSVYDASFCRFAQEGDWVSAERLAGLGADVNALGFGDMAALHWAAELCSPEGARALLRWGAFVDIRNAVGTAPLLICSLKASAYSADHRAGALACMEALLLHGANPNAVNAHGAPPLRYALDRAGFCAEAALLLLAAGADPNWANPQGETPLALLCRFPPMPGLGQVAAALIERGARVEPALAPRAELLKANSDLDFPAPPPNEALLAALAFEQARELSLAAGSPGSPAASRPRWI